MSSTDEPTVDPIDTTPAASYEVIQKTVESPRPSFESVNAETRPRSSVETVRLSEDPKPSQPSPSVDYEKRGVNQRDIHHG